MKNAKFGVITIFIFLLSACGNSGGNGEVGTVGAGSILYEQDFSGLSDGSAWPDSWVVAQGSNVVSATIQAERACLEGLQHTAADSGEMNLARLVKTDIQAQNVDIRFDVSYENFQNQGVGFYGRQNGGFFLISTTPGEGYGVFVEGFNTDGVTLWYEDDGDEIQHEIASLAGPLGTDPSLLTTPTFSVRYQVESSSVTETTQRAKVWLRDTQSEPASWQVVSDAINIDAPGMNPLAVPSLQNIPGGFAIDVFNSNTAGGSACFDNIVIREIL